MLETPVGSTAFGTDLPTSDLDLMAVIVPSRAAMVGFHTQTTWDYVPLPPRQQPQSGDWIGHSLRSFFTHALKGNVQFLTPFYATPTRCHVPTGDILRSMAPDILSKRVHAPARGIITSTLRKDPTDLKRLAFAVRTGLAALHILRRHHLPLPLPEAERERVIAIRRGHHPVPEVHEMLNALTLALDVAYERSQLPDHPNTARVEKWMIDAHMRYWKRSFGE